MPPSFSIREARPDDAALLIDYVLALAAEPDVDIPLRPEEFAHTVETERDYIAEMHAADNSVLFLALEAREIIGELGLRGGKRQATRHAATLGISVRRDHRNRGIGSALMAHAIRWARQSRVLSRIDLYVYARNAPAVHLYEKYGFNVEGRRRQAIFHRGQFVDDLLMALLLP